MREILGFKKDRVSESRWQAKDPALKLKISITDTSIELQPEFSSMQSVPSDATRPKWHRLGKLAYTEINDNPKRDDGHFFCPGFALIGRTLEGKTVSLIVHHTATADEQKAIRKDLTPLMKDFLAHVEPGTVDAVIYASTDTDGINGAAIHSSKKFLADILGFPPRDLLESKVLREALRVPKFDIALNPAARQLWIIRSFK
jgi:hypothetical protein